MSAKYQKIEAVFDKDLEKVLNELNLYEKIIKNEANCYFCKKIVTLENLQFIFSQDNEIKVSCDEQDCINKFRKNIKNGN